jgi:cell fate (sporulation/competence/biofilm development) regulator YmcA (YheA/YmcA/DUF963 family)
MKLNIEQQECKEKILQFLSENKNDYFGIYGAGGTGKTFTLSNTINEFKGSVLFLGATNKVVTVLKSSLESSGFLNPKVKTIDSFLKFKIQKDEFNNSTISYTFPPIKTIPELLVIDEVSMITNQKFKLIEDLKKHCKIILIGDFLQLPPIEDNKDSVVRNSDGFLVSKIFTAVKKENSYTLTIQNRQKDGTELSSLVSGFRNHMHLKIDPIKLAEKKHNNLDIQYYFTNDPKLKDEIKRNNCVAVCFKNLSVLNFNWLIGSTKSMRKDYRLNEINIGDFLMFDSFYFYEKNRIKTSFYTSNIIEVIEIETGLTETFTIKEKIKKVITYSILKVKDGEEIREVRYIQGGLYGQNGGGLSSSVYGQRKTYTEHINKGKNVKENIDFLKDLNTRFSNYQNSFAKLKKPYAITAHKAQGSTYNTVIIPVYDYYTKFYKDANQLLYVALSRAKEKVIFVNKKEQFGETDKRKLFTEFEKQSICSAYDYKCVDCRTDLLDREFDIDHKIPLASGGKNSVENLQPLCKSCHTKKSNFEKYNKSYQKY